MKVTLLGICVAAGTLAAAPAAAQHTGGAGVDVTLARHSTRGGLIDFRTGVLLDVLGAGRVRTEPRWSFVAAGGIGAVIGGFGDSCLLKPDGGCAAKANFVVVSGLGGVARPIGRATARALVGPAVYRGAGDTSVGVQARLDFSIPALAHLGIGAMARGTILPSHGGDWLTPWAAGGSLTLR